MKNVRYKVSQIRAEKLIIGEHLDYAFFNKSWYHVFTGIMNGRYIIMNLNNDAQQVMENDWLIDFGNRQEILTDQEFQSKFELC